MKDWDVTIAQLILLIIGGYYLYEAFRIITYHGSQTYTSLPQAFVFTMTIGIILLGLALALQQIRSYRRKRKTEIS